MSESSSSGVQVPWTDIAAGIGVAAKAAGTALTPYYQIRTAQLMQQPQFQFQGSRTPVRKDNTMLWVVGGVAAVAAIGLAIFAVGRRK